MPYTNQEIANALDLAVLKPMATAQDVIAACNLAVEHNVKAVCVAPIHVALAASLCNNVAAVIGFPHGNTLPSVKHIEAIEAINLGATELDVVINYGCFLSGNAKPVISELRQIVATAEAYDVCVKAILEAGYYNDSQIRDACILCADEGVDFVKNATGFAPCGGATPRIMQAMLDATYYSTSPIGVRVEVKASGGIKTYAECCQYLDMGCTRIGASKLLFNPVEYV
jgi:deoxyribose-phosphate aldolase